MNIKIISKTVFEEALENDFLQVFRCSNRLVIVAAYFYFNTEFSVDIFIVTASEKEKYMKSSIHIKKRFQTLERQRNCNQHGMQWNMLSSMNSITAIIALYKFALV